MNQNMPKQPCVGAIADFIAKVTTISCIDDLSIGESVGIDKTVSRDEMRQWCDTWSKGEKRYVFTEHEGSYQVGRVQDNVNIELFYSKPKPVSARMSVGAIATDSELLLLMQKTLESYMAIDEAKLHVYVSNPLLRERRVVPREYLMRKLYSYKVFKASENKVALLDKVIDMACTTGMYPVLMRVDKDNALKQFNSNAKLFFININVLASGQPTIDNN